MWARPESKTDVNFIHIPITYSMGWARRASYLVCLKDCARQGDGFLAEVLEK